MYTLFEVDLTFSSIPQTPNYCLPETSQLKQPYVSLEELRPSIFQENQPTLIAASWGKSKVDPKVEDYQVLAESVLDLSRW